MNHLALISLMGLALALGVGIACSEPTGPAGAPTAAATSDPPPPDPAEIARLVGDVADLPEPDTDNAVAATIDVEGMTCSGCEYNVSSALRRQAGVLAASADHDAGMATVTYDPGLTDLETLAQAVRDVGYDSP